MATMDRQMTSDAQLGLDVSGCRLDSWKEIAVYLGRNVRTVQRWEKSEGLPIHRQVHEKSGSVHAFAQEINDWRKSRSYCKLLEREQGLPASAHFDNYSFNKKELLILRKLLEAILAHLTAQTTNTAVTFAPNELGQVTDIEIPAGRQDLGSRRDKFDGNSVQSHTFLPHMQ